MSRGKLTALLWADQSEDVARHSLRQCLLDLRHALSKANVDAIRADGDLISLQPSSVVVDVASFERLTNQSTTNALNQAMSLYQGDLLEGFSLDEQAFEDWLQIARERLRSRAVQVLRKLLADRVRAKVPEDAIDIGIRLLTFEPFDETVHRTLMHLYAESGRRSTALRQYEACVELLSRELRVEPEVETRDLYRRLVSERGDGPKPHPTARCSAEADFASRHDAESLSISSGNAAGRSRGRLRMAGGAVEVRQPRRPATCAHPRRCGHRQESPRGRAGVPSSRTERHFSVGPRPRR